ncbi:hypothetical protein HD806DRAFT_530123 [Xylariaceae sp. AK1471]|nr:hypothetical protein HD806DRAFT_530123 [Xylariaceae sp. AK1471]
MKGKSLYRADARSASTQVAGTGPIRVSCEVIVFGSAYNIPQLLKLRGYWSASELKSFCSPLIKDLPGVGTDMQDRYENAGHIYAVAYVSRSSVADSNTEVIILGVPGAFPGYFLGYSNYTLGDKRHWPWLLLKGHTRNRAGTVKLVSTDQRGTPNIKFNKFAQGDQEDLQASYECFQ